MKPLVCTACVQKMRATLNERKLAAHESAVTNLTGPEAIEVEELLAEQLVASLGV